MNRTLYQLEFRSALALQVLLHTNQRERENSRLFDLYCMKPQVRGPISSSRILWSKVTIRHHIYRALEVVV